MTEMLLSADTYQKLLREGERFLSSFPEAKTDSFLLLSFLTGMTRADFFLKREDTPSEREKMEYLGMLKKRASHIPLQYITGEQEFMGLPFYVNENVLIPRQDTEILVETALPFVSGKKVLDLCTGSGCIAISLAVLGKPVSCLGTDVSRQALETAERNAERNHAGVSFLQSDLFEQIKGKFDVIVSNPPYISTEVVESLQKEVKEHEPRKALDGGADGLEFYRKIIIQGRRFLKEDGILLFEIGHDQREAVCTLMQTAGFYNVAWKKDYAGLDRVVFGWLGKGGM